MKAIGGHEQNYDPRFPRYGHGVDHHALMLWNAADGEVARRATAHNKMVNEALQFSCFDVQRDSHSCGKRSAPQGKLKGLESD